MKRYHSTEYLFSLPADEGIAVINKAFEQEEEEKLFARWIPYQGQFGFEEFKQMLKNSNAKPKSDDEIMDDVNAILAAQAKASGAMKE